MLLSFGFLRFLHYYEGFSVYFTKQETNLGRRGDRYDEIKGALGDAMLERTLELFPKLKPHLDHVDVGSPVTNFHYLRQQHGEDKIKYFF
jgi:hypothetical protein